MKKLWMALLCALVLLAPLSGAASADMGPKPSVVVELAGLDGRRCYATLLSKTESTGPYSALRDDEEASSHRPDDEADGAAFEAFAVFEDADGFHFLQFWQDCTETGRLAWTYYPPYEFKVLLYFPDENRFLVAAEPSTRYAFDSYFALTVPEPSPEAPAVEAGLVLQKAYPIGREGLSFLGRFLLTFAAELLLALVFFPRKKQIFLVIFRLNLVTQLLLNLALQWIWYAAGGLAFVFYYVLLEIFVVVLEAVLLKRWLRGQSPALPAWKPPVFSLVANAASFALGIFLATRLPLLF